MKVAGRLPAAASYPARYRFTATVPTRQIIPNKDVETCGGPREDALLEVGPDKGVRNTLVYVADVAAGKAWPAPTDVPQLVNRGCRFEPDIQVVHPGAIAIVNKDPVLHNTHGYYGQAYRLQHGIAEPEPEHYGRVAEDRHGEGRLRRAWLDGRLGFRARQPVFCRHRC